MKSELMMNVVANIMVILMTKVKFIISLDGAKLGWGW